MRISFFVNLLWIVLVFGQFELQASEQLCSTGSSNGSETIALNPILARRQRAAQRGPSQLRQVISAQQAANITLSTSSSEISEPTQALIQRPSEDLAIAPSTPVPIYMLNEENINSTYLNAFRERHSDVRALEVIRRDSGSFSELSPSSIELIAQFFPMLEGLSISNLNVNNSVVYAIATYLPGLRLLTLSHNPLLGDEAITHLSRLNALETLNINYTGLTQEGAYVLAQNFPRLRHLNVSGNLLRNEGLYRLTRAIFAPRLYALIISNVGIDTRAFSLLRSFSNLRVLNIANNNLGQYGSLVERLIDAPLSRSLQKLIVSKNDIKPEGKLALERSGVYPQMRIEYQSNGKQFKSGAI